MKNLILKKIKGFSLVELSVVVVIISITLGGALQIATTKTDSIRLNDTIEKMEVIEDAIERFVVENQRIPCPALPNDTPDDASFGYEQRNGTQPVNCSTLSSLNFVSNPDIWAGSVPVKDLLIDDEYMFDGYDRRFLYVVDDKYTNNLEDYPDCDDNESGCFAYENNNSSIIVKDANGNDLITNGVYVLISMGKDGLGAYNKYGSKLGSISSYSASDKENYEPYIEGASASFDNIFVEKPNTETYDDIIKKYTKEQIINNIGAIYTDDDLVCDSAKEIALDPLSNTICSNATDATICNNIGQKIYKLCLNYPY